MCKLDLKKGEKGREGRRKGCLLLAHTHTHIHSKKNTHQVL